MIWCTYTCEKIMTIKLINISSHVVTLFCVMRALKTLLAIVSFQYSIINYSRHAVRWISRLTHLT